MWFTWFNVIYVWSMAGTICMSGRRAKYAICSSCLLRGVWVCHRFVHVCVLKNKLRTLCFEVWSSSCSGRKRQHAFIGQWHRLRRTQTQRGNGLFDKQRTNWKRGKRPCGYHALQKERSTERTSICTRHMRRSRNLPLKSQTYIRKHRSRPTALAWFTWLNVI